MGYGKLAMAATPAANWNNVANIPADSASTVAVIFDTAFAGGTPSVCVSVTDPTMWDGYHLDARAINVTASGFDVLVSGGPAGTFVTINFIALGTGA